MRKAEQIVEALLDEGVWTDRLRRLWRRRDPEQREGDLPDNAPMTDRIRRSEEKMRQAKTHDLKAPKWSQGAAEDLKQAARQAFTAWAYADENGHHPTLWQAVQGSPYERMYRQKFAHEKL